MHEGLFCAVLLTYPVCLVYPCDFSEWVDVNVMEQKTAVAARGMKRQDRVYPQQQIAQNTIQTCG